MNSDRREPEMEISEKKKHRHKNPRQFVGIYNVMNSKIKLRLCPNLLIVTELHEYEFIHFVNINVRLTYVFIFRCEMLIFILF